MMKYETLQRIRKFLHTFMIVEAGSFIGRSLQIYTRYKKHPGYFALTDPWYVEVLHWGLMTGLVIVITVIIYWVIGQKIKRYETKE